MAIYTDFFVASDAELRAAFPGWAALGASPTRDAPPPQLGELPRVEMKSVDPTALAHLLAADGGMSFTQAIAACAHPALVAPEPSRGTLELVRVPTEVLSILTRPADARAAVAAKWEAALLADFATIANPHAREHEIGRWTGACASIVERLSALATARRTDQQMYLLVTL